MLVQNLHLELFWVSVTLNLNTTGAYLLCLTKEMSSAAWRVLYCKCLRSRRYSNPAALKKSTVHSFFLSSHFSDFKSHEETRDCTLLSLRFPERFAALWMFKGQGRSLGKMFCQCCCCFHTGAESKTCQRLSSKTLWVSSLSPVHFQNLFCFYIFCLIRSVWLI